MASTKKAKTEKKEKNLVLTSVPSRGRIFEGTVTKIFPTRVVVEFQRPVYVRKYQRYFKKKTRLHSRIPSSLASQINVGDYVRVQECRPLSKIIHSVVIKKIRNAMEAKK